MFDSPVYLFDTRKRSGRLLVPGFVARLVVRFVGGWDFGNADASAPVR